MRLLFHGIAQVTVFAENLSLQGPPPRKKHQHPPSTWLHISIWCNLQNNDCWRPVRNTRMQAGVIFRDIGRRIDLIKRFLLGCYAAFKSLQDLIIGHYNAQQAKIAHVMSQWQTKLCNSTCSMISWWLIWWIFSVDKHRRNAAASLAETNVVWCLLRATEPWHKKQQSIRLKAK